MTHYTFRALDDRTLTLDHSKWTDPLQMAPTLVSKTGCGAIAIELDDGTWAVQDVLTRVVLGELVPDEPRDVGTVTITTLWHRLLILWLVLRVWNRHPRWRLSQLITNASTRLVADQDVIPAVYYTSDEKLEQVLRDALDWSRP